MTKPLIHSPWSGIHLFLVQYIRGRILVCQSNLKLAVEVHFGILEILIIGDGYSAENLPEMLVCYVDRVWKTELIFC